MEWIFGYGSLVWRPDFAFTESHPARIDGFVRRFWQGSTDHRGTPEFPGRVVTLVERGSGSTWGRVFRVAPEAREAVFANLNHRERGGYSRELVSAVFDDQVLEAVTYRATEDNPNFLGPLPMSEMVEQVLVAVGPSGPNTEYVLKLAQALREMGASDGHTLELADAVRRRL